MVLAVTGTIGSGKSTVCGILENMGYPVVSADEVGHKILFYEDVKEKIVSEFGDVLDGKGNIDRKKLSDTVFRSEERVRKLNDITHPVIREEIKKEIADLSEKHSDVVCEIPLLFECGFEDLADKILLVYVSEETALKRLLKRGMTEEDAKKRLKNQMDYTKKTEKSDFFISNEENLEKLAFKVAKVFNK